MNRSTLLAIPLAALALAAAGCGSSSSSSSSSGSSGSSSSSSSSSSGSGSTGSSGASTSGGAAASGSGGGVSVSMKSLAFNPATVHVKVGQSVTWTNDDSPPHNVTYVSGPKFASSPQVMNPGAKYTVKFTQAGTVHYFCSIHPFMKATVVVGG